MWHYSFFFSFKNKIVFDGAELEKEMATHSSILAWEIPWTEEPGRLHVHGVVKKLDVTSTKQ